MFTTSAEPCSFAIEIVVYVTIAVTMARYTARILRTRRSVRRSPGILVPRRASGIADHPYRGVHPREVVPLEVAEEDVTPGLQPYRHLLRRTILDALDLL